MWVTGSGLGRDEQLAGGNTDSILIIFSLILPLQIPLECWSHQFAELAVACADDKVGHQEGEVLLVPPLPGSQLLGSLAQRLL